MATRTAIALVGLIILVACGAPMRTPTTWTAAPAYADCRAELDYDFDQPRELKPGASSVFDERWVGGPDPARFVAEVTGRSGYRSEGQPRPLASVVQVTAHGTRGGPVLASWQGADLTVDGGTEHGFQHDGRGAYAGTRERLRIALGTRGAAALQARPDGVLFFVACDGAGAVVFVTEKNDHYQHLTPPRK